MPVPHTGLSRLTVVAVCALATALAVVGADDATLPYLDVLIAVAAVVALACAAKLARDNCFESRLFACLTALAALGGALSAATIGLPGQEPGTSVSGVVLVVACVAVVALTAAETVRRARPNRPSSPYAP